MTDRQARDLPLDAHMHTDLSPDSNVPIDTYAAAALEHGIAEIAITDHVDFEPGAPAFALLDLRGPRADRPRRGRALGPAGRRTSGSASSSPTTGRGRRTSATTSRATPTTSRSARSTTGSTRRTARATSRPGSTGRSLAEIVAPSFDEVDGGGPVRACSTPSATSTCVKRYLYPHVLPAAFEAAPELYEPILRALVESGTALEVNTSGLRYPVGVHVPAPGDRGPVPRARRPGGDDRLGRPPAPSNSRTGASATATRSRRRPGSTRSDVPPRPRHGTV